MLPLEGGDPSELSERQRQTPPITDAAGYPGTFVKDGLGCVVVAVPDPAYRSHSHRTTGATEITNHSKHTLALFSELFRITNREPIRQNSFGKRCLCTVSRDSLQCGHASGETKPVEPLCGRALENPEESERSY
jgi:hypothetical protein